MKRDFWGLFRLNCGTWCKPDISRRGKFVFFSVIVISVFSLIHAQPVLSQQPFTPLEQGEYKIEEESTEYDPGAQFSGSYRAFATGWRDGILLGKELGGTTQQEFEINIHSMINTNISLNVVIGNRSALVEEQETAYDTRYASEKGDSSSDTGMDVIFKEAYLEYNHNPNAKLRIGKYFVNIADRKGLIYQGIATAISQDCRIGTWCYSIGGARLAEGGSSAVYWLQLDYPVYQSGKLIPDPWAKDGTRQRESFNIELFRAMHKGTDIPIASSGHWVGENSSYHDTTGDSYQGPRVYFENDEVEYMGFNIKWYYNSLKLNFSWVNLTGKRKYYAGYKDQGGTFIKRQRIAGYAFLLDLDYLNSKEWQSGFTLFSASGNEQKDYNAKFWDKDSDAFLEIKKGSYGNAFIYFNGRDGTGQGHSVSNLFYYALRASYRSAQKDKSAEIALYSFKRNKPVFINQPGEAESKDTDIGIELDASFTWQLEKRLSLKLFAAIFQTGAAYTPNDNVRPIEKPEDFSLIGIDCRYDF